MPSRRVADADDEAPRPRPATTQQAREAQMIDLADRLAEKQLRDGSASAQVISHYLKLGSSREYLEQQRLAAEIKYSHMKTEALESQQRVEQMYGEALAAMRNYAGYTEGEDF